MVDTLVDGTSNRYTEEQLSHIHTYIEEAVREKTIAANAADNIKDYANTCKEMHGIPTKEFNALVKHHYQNFLDEQEEVTANLRRLYNKMFAEKG